MSTAKNWAQYQFYKKFLYARLREKFDAGVEMQLDYDELEKHCRENKRKRNAQRAWKVHEKKRQEWYASLTKEDMGLEDD